MKPLDHIATHLPPHQVDDISIEAAQEFLSGWVEPLPDTEKVGIFQALGRVLAHDVISPVSVPPHDNAAMDGFALASSDLQHGSPTRLQSVGSVLAGHPRHPGIETGQCLKIMTGAVMPHGLDTVVPIELVQVSGDRITIPAGAVKPGDHRRHRGEDLTQGQAALRAGQILGPAALGLLASLGLASVTVRRRLKVAFCSTGDEILSLGEPPREGAVYDSNRYTLFGLLSRLGVELLDLGVVKDDPQVLESTLREAAQQADVVLTSGGVSVGEADHTRALMQRLGEIVFWRIAMRPGRPMAVGRLPGKARDTVLFGLPGNPVAVMVTFLALVRPALLKMMGAQTQAPLLLRARSAEPLRKKPGRTEYQRGYVDLGADGQLWVRSTGPQGSGVLRSMVEANGLIVLHHPQGAVAAGDWVDVLPFDGAI